MMESILPDLRRRLAQFHVDRLSSIEDFDYGKVVKKTSADTGVSDPAYLRAGVENLKRYYAVALLDPLNRHAVSAAVDPFWHSHVLFTRDYIQFCNVVFGQYVHHEPLDRDDMEEAARVNRLYDYTLAVYRRMFVSVDERWWPNADETPATIVCLHQDIQTDEVARRGLYPRIQTLTAA